MSNEIQRYRVENNPLGNTPYRWEATDGPYVLYTDYAALQAALRKLAYHHLLYVAHYGTCSYPIVEEVREEVSRAVAIPLMKRADAEASKAKELLKIHFPDLEQ